MNQIIEDAKTAIRTYELDKWIEILSHRPIEDLQAALAKADGARKAIISAAIEDKQARGAMLKAIRDTVTSTFMDLCDFTSDPVDDVVIGDKVLSFACHKRNDEWLMTMTINEDTVVTINRKGDIVDEEGDEDWKNTNLIETFRKVGPPHMKPLEDF